MPDLTRIRGPLLVLAVLAPLVVVPGARAAGSPLVPDTAAFGDQDVHNGPQQKTVSFENSSGGDISVASLALLGGAPGFALVGGGDGCTGATIADGGACSVQVQFAPADTGAQSGTLELTDADGNTADAPLSGTGRVGALALPTPSFPEQPTYFGDPRTDVQLSDGSSDWGVRTTSFAFTGPDAARFSIAYGQNCATGQTLAPGNSCSMGIQMQASPVGTYHANLEVVSDDDASPLVVPLTVTELAGPRLEVSPSPVSFGAVPVGSDRTQTVRLMNGGDFPLGVAEVLVVTGRPEAFFTTDDACTAAQLAPGASCQVAVHFRPSGPGPLDASLFMVAGNDSQPVRSVGLQGTGVVPPDGAAALAGDLTAGHRLTCRPVGFPADAHLATRWLRGGRALASAGRAPAFALTDADVGARFSCELAATSAGGTRTVRSAASAPVSARDLSGLAGAFVRSRQCREVTGAGALKLAGVAIGSGSPVTPADPLRFRARVPLRLAVDGEPVDSGTHVNVDPEQLAQFADGPHALSVRAGGRSARGTVLLTACRLAVRLRGGAGRTSRLAVSSRTGLGGLTLALPRTLRFALGAGRAAGLMSYTRAGSAPRLVGLVGPRSRSGGVAVTLSRGGLRVTGLPRETGLVSFRFRPGVLGGSGGTVRAVSTLRGARVTRRAAVRGVWSGPGD